MTMTIETTEITVGGESPPLGGESPPLDEIKRQLGEAEGKLNSVSTNIETLTAQLTEVMRGLSEFLLADLSQPWPIRMQRHLLHSADVPEEFRKRWLKLRVYKGQNKRRSAGKRMQRWALKQYPGLWEAITHEIFEAQPQRLAALKGEMALDESLEKARTVEMTPEQQEAQRRSFAFGNTSIENPNVTREMVDEAAERIKNST